ncbi:MAG: type VI secretion system baseplate subunit TssK, partial [Limnobacter sp.]|nr:type VI secretion system baseplate subunit TssK [Limnobacter sp.]
MSVQNAVIWADGLFLLPQHFQQTERHLKSLLAFVTRASTPYFTGFTSCQLDTRQLLDGVVSLESASGILPDGTPFVLPLHNGQPLGVHVRPEDTSLFCYLCLPAPHWHANQLESAAADNTAANPTESARYTRQATELANTHESDSPPELLELAQPNWQIRLAAHMPEGFSGLCIAQIQRVGHQGEVELSPTVVPTPLHIGSSAYLSKGLARVLSLMENQLARLGDRHQNRLSGSAEISDFLLFQTLSQHLLTLRHLQDQNSLHPERLFVGLLALRGALAAFEKTRKACNICIPTAKPFARSNPCLANSTPCVSGATEQRALQIPLQKQPYGHFLGVLHEENVWAQS